METNENICSTCGNETSVEIYHATFWCKKCNVPFVTIMENNSVKSGKCPSCGEESNIRYEDIRPVFPEERILGEMLCNVPIYSWLNSSVWKAKDRYIVDGISYRTTPGVYEQLDLTTFREKLKKNQQKNNKDAYPIFNNYIAKFVDLNESWLNQFTQESVNWVRSTRENPKYRDMNFMVSFSGGKDSTAVSDIVMKAIGSPRIMHLFGDTTLEFPLTYEYIEKYKATHSFTPVRTVVNKDQKFQDLVDEIGPPARLMRWCCSMFKTGPITRKLNQMCKVHEDDENKSHDRIFTYYGIRKNESVSRSKYDRIAGTNESIKIRKQVVGSPIFFWKDVDVWLYLLANKVIFNDAYRLGYDRVGCWCCPNNNQRSQFLSRIYMPEESQKWRNTLIKFAIKVGKPDPEVYVDSGKWKARQGGNGLAISKQIKIQYSNCTSEEDARVFKLQRPLNEEFYSLMVPFGFVKKGRVSLNEVVVYHTVSNMQIISIIPFSQNEYLYSVKIKVLNVKDKEDLFRMIGYQIRKFNSCKKCLKCESICKYGAISITTQNGYRIDSKKCRHCLICVNQKYLPNGCLMGKYLRSKEDKNEN
ncbi:MAG: phosphoadenosine phosphosulfate reductase family protein [Sphaerochaetaceae bacterium]